MANLDRRNFLKASVITAGAGSAMVLAACSNKTPQNSGSAAGSAAGSASSTSNDAAKAEKAAAFKASYPVATTTDEAKALATHEAGKLTIATGEPAWPPYVMDDAPETGEGFEAAVAYAVAAQLGFAYDDVVWVRTSFDNAITPGDKDWDVNIQQFGITEERKAAVDFSSPYFTPTQSVVVDAAKDHDKFAKATSLSELKDASIGMDASSTALAWTQEKIGSNVQPLGDTVDSASQLNLHQIDGVVTDTPTAVYMANPDNGELDNAKLIGQIPGSKAEPLAFILPKGSKLTAPVTAAVDALTKDGKIEELTKQWMAEYTTEIPTLSE